MKVNDKCSDQKNLAKGKTEGDQLQGHILDLQLWILRRGYSDNVNKLIKMVIGNRSNFSKSQRKDGSSIASQNLSST